MKPTQLRLFIMIIFFHPMIVLSYPNQTTEKLEWQKEQAYNFLAEAWFENKYQSLMSETISIDTLIPVPREIFSTMVILELLGDLHLDPQVKQQMLDLIKTARLPDGTFYFFEEQAILPRDVDTTSFGVSLLLKENAISLKEGLKTVETILTNTIENGIIQVYIDPPEKRKGRLDPFVCANALYLINLYGKAEEAHLTENFVYQSLLDDSYLKGTLYYASGDAFLYILARLVTAFPRYQHRFESTLKEKLMQRIGTSDNPLDLALRVITAHQLHINNSKEQELLAKQQLNDGSWPAYAFFKGNTQYKYFGSKALTTAFAIRALDIDTY